MTRPTGRPKGRPPADPYTSFTARLREDVAARIVTYANRQGLPLSALLRRWWEEGLAREEPGLVSDDKGVSSHAALLSDTKESPVLAYDIKEDVPLMMSRNNGDLTVADGGQWQTSAARGGQPGDAMATATRALRGEALAALDRQGQTVADDSGDTLTSTAEAPASPAAKAAIVSDMQGDSQESTILVGTTGGAVILSHTNEETVLLSDRKADTQPALLSDNKGDSQLPTLSHTKGEPRPVLLSDMQGDASLLAGGTEDGPLFDGTKYQLGALCGNGHDYQGTGQSLRRRSDRECLACHNQRAKSYRQRKRLTAPGA